MNYTDFCGMPRLQHPIYLNDYSVVSALDASLDPAATAIRKDAVGTWIAPLASKHQRALEDLLARHERYRHLDLSVQLAILAASQLKNLPPDAGINIGSSRGATGLWEASHRLFVDADNHHNPERQIPVQTSPLTTLGNISSWTAQHLGIDGPALSHSITCATASHAILNSIAWLQAGMATTMVAGGSEAPLTDFTIAQMRALRIYSNEQGKYPCRALDLTKKSNQIVLGEGAAVFMLSRNKAPAELVEVQNQNTKSPLAIITGYGTAIERLSSATSVSGDGENLRNSMVDALDGLDPESVDAIVTHAPGTIKGDRAEMNAITAVFGENHPALVNNKWGLGHTLGASSGMNLAMAIELINQVGTRSIPYLDNNFTNPRGRHSNSERVLVNATGFGGNAVSLLVEKSTDR